MSLRGVTERLLPKNPYSRPGTERCETLGVVWHWTGAAGQANEATRRYFEMLGNQDATDDERDAYGSAHYIIGIDGNVMRVVPDREVAYHCGAIAYPAWLRRRYPRYTTNGYCGTPNWCFIGVELCHPDELGWFSMRTQVAATELAVWLCRRHQVSPMDFFRHYDVTGKRCPKWWCDRPQEWDFFVHKVEEALRAEGGVV